MSYCIYHRLSGEGENNWRIILVGDFFIITVKTLSNITINVPLILKMIILLRANYFMGHFKGTVS